MKEFEHVFPWEIEEEGTRTEWIQYGRDLAEAVVNQTELPKWNQKCNGNKNVSSRKPTKESSPDTIIHFNDEGINKAAVVEAVSSFIRLTEDEKSLLLYYSTCSSGFKPAIKTITDKTGLSKRQICRSKNRLIEKNVLNWQGADEVCDKKCHLNKYIDRYEVCDKKCHLNKYTDRIVIDWRNLSAISYAAELHPEYNDEHRYRDADGKQKRQNVVKHLGSFENRLLWNNKPASYWAKQAIKFCDKKCHLNKYSIIDYTNPLEDTITISEEQPELVVPTNRNCGFLPIGTGSSVNRNCGFLENRLDIIDIIDRENETSTSST